MAFWLLKSEPDSYSWDDLVRDGGTEWDGVRNNAAAGHMRAMAVGDEALFYHSGKDKAAVGRARIARAARKDGAEGNWVSVRIEPLGRLAHPVTLATMKSEPRLGRMAMLRQSRLSVSPVGEEEWRVLIALGDENI